MNQSIRHPIAPESIKPDSSLVIPRVDDPAEDVEVLIHVTTLPMPQVEDPKAPTPKTPPTRTHVWSVNDEYLGHVDSPATHDRTPRAYTPSGSLLVHRTRREAIWSLIWDYEVRHNRFIDEDPNEDAVEGSGSGG